MGAYKNALIDYLDGVILPNIEGYSSLTAEAKNQVFDLVQDCLLTNGLVTITAGSSTTGQAVTYTLSDLESYAISNQ